MTLSPLLRFALDSFEEAVKQYLEGTDKSNKFCVLHCDHAVELILKEKLREMGISIYEKNGRTIDFHDALNTLDNNKGVKIQERADLELIHDQRNIIQHRGATVSKEDADFYLRKAYDFMKRFLKDALNLQLRDVLDARYYDIFEPKVKQIKAQATIKVTDTAEVRGIPLTEFLSTVLVEYRNLEVAIRDLAIRKGLSEKFSSSVLVARLTDSKVLPKDTLHFFAIIKNLRNEVAHTGKSITEEEMKDYILAVMRLRTYIEGAAKK